MDTLESELCRRNFSRPNALRPFAAVTSCERGQAIYGLGDPAGAWYCVLSDLAKKSAVMPNGRRQIVAFLLPGNFFGMTARHSHVMVSEVVIDGTRIARFPRQRLETITDADPEVGRLIRALAFESISRLQASLLILGRITAVEKVGSFLIEMAERLPGGSAKAVVLPMSRYDIADYLAMLVETVSRALTDLKHSGAISFSGRRQIRIVDRSALEEDSGWMPAPP